METAIGPNNLMTFESHNLKMIRPEVKGCSQDSHTQKKQRHEFSKEIYAVDEEIPDREVTDVIAQFLSLVIFLTAFKFSENVSVPGFRTSFFPRHNNAFSHA